MLFYWLTGCVGVLGVYGEEEEVLGKSGMVLTAFPDAIFIYEPPRL